MNKTADHIPAEVRPLGSYLCEEMICRGWTTDDVATRMGGATPEEVGRDMLVVSLVLSVHRDNLRFDDDTLAKLAMAFDVSPDFLRNLDTAWRANPESRAPFEPPDEVFGPVTSTGFASSPA